jgi:hypothetical protein
MVDNGNQQCLMSRHSALVRSSVTGVIDNETGVPFDHHLSCCDRVRRHVCRSGCAADWGMRVFCWHDRSNDVHTKCSRPISAHLSALLCALHSNVPRGGCQMVQPSTYFDSCPFAHPA